jgi:ssDNA-binding Zn-finger/Zn-ribbon topoisomerase 1
MNEDQIEDRITITCPDCQIGYPLSLDTLKATGRVYVACRLCGADQLIRINKRGEIHIQPNPVEWKP